MEPIVNVAIGDYDALRDRVKELESQIEKLRSERDEFCDQNKVRYVRVKYSNYIFLTDSVTETEIDEVRNMDDVLEEIESIHEAELKKKNAQIAALREKSKGLEEELEELKNRSFFKRIFNK